MVIKSLFREVPELAPTNITELCLHRRPADEPDYTFQIDATTGFKRSWREFKTRVGDAMTALAAPESLGGLSLQLENKEIVGVLSPNALDYVTIMYALWGLTIPICPLSSYSTLGELQHLLRDSTVSRLFVHPSLLPLALDAASKVGLNPRHIYILEGHVEGRRSLGEIIDNVLSHGSKVQKAQVRPVKHDTLAYLLFSSGTSGTPKSVMVSHSNLVFQMHQTAIVNEANEVVLPKPPPGAPTPVTLGFLPLHHTFGIGYSVLRPTQSPLTVIIMPKWDVNLALDLIPKYGIRRIPLIPSVILQILEVQKTKKADLSSLAWIGSGAAYLPDEVRQRISAQLKPDCIVSQGWGMSELTLTATTTVPPGVLADKTKPAPGSVGLLWPSLEAKVVLEDGTEAAVGKAGELYVRGRSVALGYWQNEKATKETFLPGGWLRTGDQFRVDEWGNLFFVDRVKDTLKISGMQVAPTEIEDTMLAEPRKLISDVAVAGVSGGRTADELVPRAWIVLNDAGKQKGAEATVQMLDDYVKKHLSKYKHLRGGIEVVEAIPKSPTGKVLRRELTRMYEEKQKVKAKL